MDQLDLDLAVAGQTGETLRVVKQRGFSIADPAVVEFDPEPPRRPLVVDWDAVDHGRRLLMPC